MRLLLKYYIEETRRILETASMMKPAIPDDLKELLMSSGSTESLLLTRRDP